MEGRAKPIAIHLDPAEVLALYSFLALGAHFAAIVSGENSPFSSDELRAHIATIGEIASNTLMDKVVGAVVAAREPHREQLSKTSPEG
jgi:uroporphyrinogen-III synthase